MCNMRFLKYLHISRGSLKAKPNNAIIVCITLWVWRIILIGGSRGSTVFSERDTLLGISSSVGFIFAIIYLMLEIFFQVGVIHLFPLFYLNTKTNNNNSAYTYMQFPSSVDVFAKSEQSYCIYILFIKKPTHTLSASLLLNTRRNNMQTGGN